IADAPQCPGVGEDAADGHRGSPRQFTGMGARDLGFNGEGEQESEREWGAHGAQRNDAPRSIGKRMAGGAHGLFSRPAITLMLLRLLRPAALAIFAPLTLAAQDAGREYVPALVGRYNVENLFDTLESPGVDDVEFLPGSAKRWGTERYLRKVNKMAAVIADVGRDVHPRGLAILGLSEVENRSVVEDLVAAEPLRERGYRVVHEDSPDRRGVDVALIYDPSVFQVYAHRAVRLHTADTAFRTRDQLLVSGVLDGDTTHVIVNHWPSRRGGEKRSAHLRKAA